MTIPNYQDLWDKMVINNEPLVIKGAKLILKGIDRYKGVVIGTNVPWQFIGVTHYRESSCNFQCHPHEGSPLSARTLYVPKNRPKTGNPPFTWEESARDCYFNLKKLDKIETWDMPTILGTLEAFNGMGYVKYHPEVLSPYLWSKTSHYVKGKYASDGKFDPELVDKQVGTAPLYLYLTDLTKGIVSTNEA